MILQYHQLVIVDRQRDARVRDMAALGHTQISTTQRYTHSTLKRTAASIVLSELLGRHSKTGTVGSGACKGLKNGAKNRTRTDDLLITNQLLYRLSYLGSRPGFYPRHGGL